MKGSIDSPRRVLVFVAHPDDETIGCSALLQRAEASLVVFAVDGAPPHYGFEKRYGSLQRYSHMRFLEASLAVRNVPRCSLRRLTRPDGAHFRDQHLFQQMADAFTSLNQLALDCSPDLIVTHACEGGHIDHDACHYLAKHVAAVHGLPVMEFPLYRKNDHDQDIFQQFRNVGEDEMVLELTEQEMEVKRQMIAAYKTQQGLTSVFHIHTERFRAVRKGNGETCSWPDYAFENRRERLKASAFLQKIAEFERSLSITLGTSLGCET